MIKWELIALDRSNQNKIIDLLASSSREFSLKETDYIQFKVIVDKKTFEDHGVPYVLLGDVALELKSCDNNQVFISSEPLNEQSSRFFFNFFGKSELGLFFKKSDYSLPTCIVDILARTENAQLASEMLNYISPRLEDAASICFSRSKLTGGHDKANSFNFTRLDIIEKAINYLSTNWSLFIQNHKYTWKSEMQFSERIGLIGPDTIYWVLSHLDSLSPASTDESTLIYNHRSYRLDTLPREGIVNEYDVYENRVLHTFLYTISLSLIEFRDKFNSFICSNRGKTNNDYVRFDHTMQEFTDLTLKHKIGDVERLLVSVEQIRNIFVKKIPARVVPGIQLKITSYVVKHRHYREVFELIDKFNAAPAPTFEGREVLLGLKNIAIVYEISSLLMLDEAIKRCFHVKQIEQNYRLYSENSPFGGNIKKRSYGEVNNYFAYRNDTFDIELFYEPKIFPYSELSSIGDLIDTSNSKASPKYGKHHHCPDFIVQIRSKYWRKPIAIILDAKYKNSKNVKKHDIGKLTQKYLLNIHKINNVRGIGVSPVQLLLILFAHDEKNKSKYVRTVAPRHCLTGDIPILPQSTAVLLNPKNTTLLDKHLEALITVMDKKSKQKVF